MGKTVINGDFEWDADKAASNLAKHGVSFEEAATVFQGFTAEGPDAEFADRLSTFGFSSTNARVLLVVSTEGDEDRVRIISARPATSAERRAFTEG